MDDLVPDGFLGFIASHDRRRISQSLVQIIGPAGGMGNRGSGTSMTSQFGHSILAVKKRLPMSLYTRDVILTILLWWLYIFFMKDMFFFLADVMRWAWHGFTDAQNYKTFEALPPFVSYMEVMGILVVIYIGWVNYNQMRFRGKNRRFASIPVKLEDLASFYALKTHEVESWQREKTLTIHHDRKGRIIRVEPQGYIHVEPL